MKGYSQQKSATIYWRGASVRDHNQHSDSLHWNLEITMAGAGARVLATVVCTVLHGALPELF